MKRRDFLFGAGALTLTTSLAGQESLADLFRQGRSSGLSILQGLTNETTTQLSVDVAKKISTAYTLTDTKTKRVIEPDYVNPHSVSSSNIRVDQLKFSSLELGHRYQLKVVDKATNALLDERFLSTVDLNKPGARIGILSCMNDISFAKDSMWNSAEAANLDYFFFIGDNVYGDLLIMHGPQLLWNRYIDSRATIPFYAWKNLKPVIANWDDHDFGKNDSDGTYNHKANSHKVFKIFFAQQPISDVFESGPGNSYIFKAFSQNFAFFDDRYFRALPTSAGTKGFFGDEQIAFMNQKLNSSTLPTWIIQGAPFFGRLQKGSSYESTAPEELESFLKVLKSWRAPLAFAAGDLHYTEISELNRNLLGYNTFEIISSSMHSFTKTEFYDNPNKRTHGYLNENFIVIEQVENQSAWKTTCVGSSRSVQFETVLKID